MGDRPTDHSDWYVKACVLIKIKTLGVKQPLSLPLSLLLSLVLCINVIISKCITNILKGLTLTFHAHFITDLFLILENCPKLCYSLHEYARFRLGRYTGCSLNIVFFLNIFRTLASLGFLGVSVWTQWQVKHQHCNRTGRVKKNHKTF